jgi:hypothetical protein
MGATTAAEGLSLAPTLLVVLRGEERLPCLSIMRNRGLVYFVT